MVDTGYFLFMDRLTAWINELISKNKLYSFYKSPEWLALRGQVMADNHNECRVCARPWEFPELCGKETAARYTRAQTVHHVYTVKRHPYWALSRYVTIKGQRIENLLPLCDRHHNEIHKRFCGNIHRKKPVTEEKW